MCVCVCVCEGFGEGVWGQLLPILVAPFFHSLPFLQTTHHVSSKLADAKSREVATLQAALDEVRRQLAHEKETVASRDRRVAELEHATHGHGATQAEVDALRSRVDTLTRTLADKTREADEARRALETEKELHLKKEAEWRAGGGHASDDDDHAGFLQVATLLEEQGVKHPGGTKALASTLAKFFERQMADVMASAERGDKVADTPAHDISSKLIQTLTEQGVTSSHGLDHFFQTIDHLTDAALTHWAPSPPGDHAQHHADAHAQAAHHGGGGHHDAHAQPDAAHHGGGDHHADAAHHGGDHHAEGRHKPDASGFVM